jgi:hypothetical protein
MVRRGKLAAFTTAVVSSLFLWSSLATAQEPIATVDVTGQVQTNKGKNKNGLTFEGVFEIQELTFDDDELLAQGLLSGELVKGGKRAGKKPKAADVIEDVEVSIPVSALEVIETETACQVLALALGPVDLSLLGLNVHLDQVVLDVTADPTEGILGDLLCALAGDTGLVDIGDLLDGLILLDLLDLLGGLSPDELLQDLLDILNAGILAAT